MKPKFIPFCVFSMWVLSGIASIPLLLIDNAWMRLNGTGKVAFHFLSQDVASTYMFWLGLL